MEKRLMRAGNMEYPLPAVMVSCGQTPENFNIITVAWTGTVCSDPALCYISVRKERHSYNLIKQYGEFVLNLTTEKLAKATDWCGVRSGRDFNKFAEMHLTPVKATHVKAPLVGESPVNIECRVKEIIPLGTHDMFIAEVLAVHVDEALIDPETNALLLEKAHLIAYSHGHYYALGRELGHFGFSVRKKGKAKRPRK